MREKHLGHETKAPDAEVLHVPPRSQLPHLQGGRVSHTHSHTLTLSLSHTHTHILRGNTCRGDEFKLFEGIALFMAEEISLFGIPKRSEAF